MTDRREFRRLSIRLPIVDRELTRLLTAISESFLAEEASMETVEGRRVRPVYYSVAASPPFRESLNELGDLLKSHGITMRIEPGAAPVVKIDKAQLLEAALEDRRHPEHGLSFLDELEHFIYEKRMNHAVGRLFGETHVEQSKPPVIFNTRFQTRNFIVVDHYATNPLASVMTGDALAHAFWFYNVHAYCDPATQSLCINRKELLDAFVHPELHDARRREGVPPSYPSRLEEYLISLCTEKEKAQAHAGEKITRFAVEPRKAGSRSDPLPGGGGDNIISFAERLALKRAEQARRK